MVFTLAILGVFALEVLSILFVLSEFSLLRVRHTSLEELIQTDHKSARTLQKIILSPDVYILSAQIGLIATTLMLGFVGYSLFVDILNSISSGIGIHFDSWVFMLVTIIGVILLLMIHTVIAHITPKMFAVERIETVALRIAPFIFWFTKVIRPFVRLLRGISASLVRLLGVKTTREIYRRVYSEEELKVIIDQSKNEGRINSEEHQLINRVFDFADKTVKMILRPRYEIVGISVDATWDEVVEIARDSGYSRFPVYEGSLDHTLGFVHLKDIFIHDHKNADFSLRGYIREPIYVYENRLLDQLLQKMKNKKVQFAIVVDERNKFTGLVTMEDIVEAMFGPIDDEFDTSKVQIKELVKDRKYLIDCGIHLEDLARELDLELTADDSVTLGGYILEHLQSLPGEGSKIMTDGLAIEVTEMDGNRIDKAIIERLVPSNSDLKTIPDDQSSSS